VATPIKSVPSPLGGAALAAADSTDPQAGARGEVEDDGLGAVEGSSDKTQVMRLDPQPELPTFKIVVLAGPRAGAEFPVEWEEFTVGRATENQLPIPDVSVSRRHVRFTKVAHGFEVVDLKSGNGTKVNGVTVAKAKVKHGDEVAIGDTVLQIIDYTAPMPERLKPINTLQSPSGAMSAPNVTTESFGAKIPPASKRPSKLDAESTLPPSPPPPRAEPPVKLAPTQPPPRKPSTNPALAPVKPARAPLNKRMKLYLGVGAAMLLFFGVAAVFKMATGKRSSGGDTDPEAGDEPKEITAAREMVVKRHDWIGALKLLEPLKESKDPVTQRWLEAVPREVGFQRTLNGAKAALSDLNFRQARAGALTITEDADVYPAAQDLLLSIDEHVNEAIRAARQVFQSGDRARATEMVDKVLASAPDNADARALKEELSRPVKVDGPRVVKVAPPKQVEAVKPPEPPKQVQLPFAGPWLTEYLANHVKEALRLAGASTDPEISNRFASLLREFSTNFQQGIELANNKHTLEAVAFLQKALKVDNVIMEKRPGQLSEDKPGREVRKQLGNIEYLLSLDCKGDEQLPMKAKHLRAALVADPGNELALKGKKQANERANQIYMEAYVDKGPNPDKAKRQFKQVMGTLSADEPNHDKAEHWLQQLDGKKDQ
jgi:pSer/pThr/pTyr-binding forkhead associated (FHA) protein/tetratricopeptide (TPR) repeat protein